MTSDTTLVLLQADFVSVQRQTGGVVMARRMRIDVSPNKREGGWVVKSGTEKTRHDTKQSAIDDAVARGRESGNAQVVIRKSDGTIQSERTYGKDPRRSKG
jgi:hypothetical protein